MIRYLATRAVAHATGRTGCAPVALVILIVFVIAVMLFAAALEAQH